MGLFCLAQLTPYISLFKFLIFSSFAPHPFPCITTSLFRLFHTFHSPQLFPRKRGSPSHRRISFFLAPGRKPRGRLTEQILSPGHSWGKTGTTFSENVIRGCQRNHRRTVPSTPSGQRKRLEEKKQNGRGKAFFLRCPCLRH